MPFAFQPGSEPLPGMTIRRVIRRGGFGEVYYAVTPAGKEVALKLVFAEQSAKELRGITQCLNLKHPNLVTLYDLREDAEGRKWVVMEYVSGNSLEDVLTTFPNGLPLAEVETWLAGIVQGVGFLHAQGLVHRDLKPGNVYSEQGQIKVGDVGLSRRLEGPRAGQYTESIGTVYYMAPEVAHGDYGCQIDVYSLGVVLYEMLTGRVPFEGETTGEVLMKHLTKAPDLALLPPSLQGVVQHALEKDPAKRTRTVQELLQEFREAAHGSTSIPDENFLPSRNVPPVRPEVAVAAAQPHARERRNDRGVSQQAAPDLAARPSSGLAHQTWWRWVIVIFAVTAIWAPASLPALIKAGMLVGTVMGVLWFTGLWQFPTRQHVPFSAHSPPPPMQRHVSPAVQAAVAAAKKKREPAPIPWGMARWASVWVLATALGTCVSLAADYGSQVAIGEPLHRTLAAKGEFVAVTIIGTWLLVFAGDLSRRWTSIKPGWAFLIAGMLLGGIAAGMNTWLLADFPLAQGARPNFERIGAIRLIDRAGQPTPAAYMVFFGLLGWMGGWRHLTNPYRHPRFRVGSVIGVGIISSIIGLLFNFPPMTAAIWGACLATTVPLAAGGFGTQRQVLPQPAVSRV